MKNIYFKVTSLYSTLLFSNCIGLFSFLYKHGHLQRIYSIKFKCREHSLGKLINKKTSSTVHIPLMWPDSSCLWIQYRHCVYMHVNIPLLCQIWQYSQFDAGHVNRIFHIWDVQFYTSSLDVYSVDSEYAYDLGFL